MKTRLKLLAAIALMNVAGIAEAASFHLVYTTSVDAVSGPAKTIDATILTDDGSFFGSNGYLVTGISGTRGSDALVYNDNLDEIFYPGNGAGDIVDSFGLTFYAGGVLYNLYKGGAGDSFYHEFDGSTGRLISTRAITLLPSAMAAVPEPATWALMLAGFAMIGIGLRRRLRLSEQRFTEKLRRIVAGETA
jgi:hypothetical protein